MKRWKLLAAAIVSAAITPFAATAAEPEKLVVLEAKVFKLHEEGFKELKLAETFQKENTQFLDPEAKAALLALLEASHDVEMITAPKMTTNDNQTAVVSVGQDYAHVASLTVELDKNGSPVFVPKLQTQSIGFKTEFTPRISADGSHLRVRCQLSETTPCAKNVKVPVTTEVAPIYEGGSMGKPIPVTQFIESVAFDTETIQTTVAIPVGHSVLIKFKKKPCTRTTVSKVPVLSDIPYMDRLFTNVGVSEGTEYTFVLVTAKTEPVVETVQPPVSAPMPVTPKPVAFHADVCPHPVPPAPTTFFSQGWQGNFNFKLVEVPSTTTLPPPTCCPQPVPVTPTAMLATPALPHPVCSQPMPAASVLCPAGSAVMQPTPAPMHAVWALGFRDTSALLTPPVATPPCCGMTFNERNFDVTRVQSLQLCTTPAKNVEILKILLEQYEVACKSGDTAKAKTIAAYCLEMDPACFKLTPRQ